MRYKPTLGGLKKAQEFLESKGYSLPIFQTNIYDDAQPVRLGVTDLRWVSGEGRIVSINDAIREYGAMYEVADVRLTDKLGGKFIEFSNNTRLGLAESLTAKEQGRDVIPEFSESGEFGYFLASNGRAIFNLTRWGKEKPSVLDRIKFRFFPRHYVAEVFT